MEELDLEVGVVDGLYLGLKVCDLAFSQGGGALTDKKVLKLL